MFDLIELSVLAQEFKALNLHSESTLRKLASGNYPLNGKLDDFPAPIKIGQKTFWRLSLIEAWIDVQAEKSAVAYAQARQRIPVAPRPSPPERAPAAPPVGHGKGRPTRKEERAAAAAGLSVREWRAAMGARNV